MSACPLNRVQDTHITSSGFTAMNVFMEFLLSQPALNPHKGQSDCSWQHTQQAYISVWLVSLTHHLFSSTSEMWSSLCHLPNLTKIISDWFTPESRGLFSLFFSILLTVEHPSETPCFSQEHTCIPPTFLDVSVSSDLGLLSPFTKAWSPRRLNFTVTLQGG